MFSLQLYNHKHRSSAFDSQDWTDKTCTNTVLTINVLYKHARCFMALSNDSITHLLKENWRSAGDLQHGNCYYASPKQSMLKCCLDTTRAHFHFRWVACLGWLKPQDIPLSLLYSVIVLFHLIIALNEAGASITPCSILVISTRRERLQN